MGELKKDNTEIVNGKHLITMSNALTRAGHGLSLSEKRIVFIALSKIDPRKPLPLDMGIYTSRITAAEYAELTGCEMHTAYEALKDAAKALYSRSITFFEPAYKRKGSPLVQVHMRWVGEVHYQAGEGWAELLWWPKILPHLMGIQGQFSSYQLQQTTALRSTYSWKLLELLNRFKKEGWAYYTIEDFATSMEATEKQKSDFGKLRTKIIEPAVKELTEKDGWVITWEVIKAGRKVKAVRFEFRRDEQIPMPLSGGEIPKKPRKSKAATKSPATPEQSPASANSP